MVFCRKIKTVGVLKGSILVLLVIISTAVILPYWRREPSRLSKIGINCLVYENLNASQNVKTIAMGSPIFGTFLTLESNIVKTSKGNVCKYIQSYEKSDAVLFHGAEILFPNPVKKQPGQVWVIFLDESPANVQIDPILVNGLFNLTHGYTRHSDVLYSYGRSAALTEKEASTVKKSVLSNYAEKKTGLGVARISQCQQGLSIVTTRLSYLKELKQYINIDLFGSCLQNSRCGEECSTKVMGEKYKFYFAFENSMCKDYITEKFWVISLQYNMVPVVQGGLSKKDYEEMAPPKSFIHVDDFSSPKHLADYLKYLDGNDTAYNEFHDWRRTHKVYVADMHKHLCDKLHDKSWSKVIEDFDAVYSHKLCRFPSSFNKQPWWKKWQYYQESHPIHMRD